MSVSDSPPKSNQVCLARILISSSVSRQSVTKAGQTTSSFFTPDAASVPNTLSV
jgi:hypothetical protein